MTTPNDSDTCAWCTHPYADHTGTKCLAKYGTRFRQYGELRLREIPVGSIVRYYTDGKDILSIKHPVTAKCVVCFHHTGDSSTLLGWREGRDDPPSTCWDVADVHPITAARLGGKCKYGLWVSDNILIRNVVVMGNNDAAMAVASPVSSGMKCAVKVCGTFNNYAEPNQPDGSHICFSCRESGRKA